MAYRNNGSQAKWLSRVNPVSGYPLTISCWFNNANLTSELDLVAVGNAAGDNYVALVFDGANSYSKGDNVVLVDNSAVSVAATGAVSSTGVWQHAACIATSTTSRSAHLNGGTSGSDPTSVSAPSGWSLQHIGGYRVGTTTYGPLNGAVADVAVWNVALTAGEIKALALGVSPLLIRPVALVYYDALDDDLQRSGRFAYRRASLVRNGAVLPFSRESRFGVQQPRRRFYSLPGRVLKTAYITADGDNVGSITLSEAERAGMVWPGRLRVRITSQ